VGPLLVHTDGRRFQTVTEAAAEGLMATQDGWSVAEDQPEPGSLPPGGVDVDIDESIKQLLADIDGDPVKAAHALALETAKGDDARPTLVAQLTELANPQES